MPEMRFHIRWPDGSAGAYYSPSLTVKDFFVAGQSYTLLDFLDRSRQALRKAGRRVQEKYGFRCNRALAQLAQIEAASRTYAGDPNARVLIEGFEELPPQPGTGL